MVESFEKAAPPDQEMEAYIAQVLVSACACLGATCDRQTWRFPRGAVVTFFAVAAAWVTTLATLGAGCVHSFVSDEDGIDVFVGDDDALS